MLKINSYTLSFPFVLLITIALLIPAGSSYAADGSVCPTGVATVDMFPFISTSHVSLGDENNSDISVAPFLIEGRDERTVGFAFPTCETRFGPFGVPCASGCPTPEMDSRFTGQCLAPDPEAVQMDHIVGLGQLTPHASSLFGTPFFGLLDTQEGLDDLLAPTENPPAIKDYNERVEACQMGGPLTLFSDGRFCPTCGQDCSVFGLGSRSTIDVPGLHPSLGERIIRTGTGQPMGEHPVRFGRNTTQTAPVDADGIRGNGCDFRHSPPRIAGPNYNPELNPVVCVTPPPGQALTCEMDEDTGNFPDPVPETRGNECNDEISREIFRPSFPAQNNPENFKVKNWLKARGMATIRCTCSGAFDNLIPAVDGQFPQGLVSVRASGLVPFGVYTLWMTEQHPAIPIEEGGTGQAGLLGDSPPLGGTPNILAADAQGRIDVVNNPIAYCPLLAERVSPTQGGRRANTVVLVYHLDHQAHGADSESATANAGLAAIDPVLGKPERRNGMVGKLIAAGPGPYGLINFNPAPSGTFLNVPSSNFETVGHLLGNIGCEVPALGLDVANPNFFSGAPQPEPCPNTCRAGLEGELCFTDADCGQGGLCGLETL